ncbi:MAG: metal ABC transporter solute-binding protein, Zn/Mn family, partial [Achromobacter piechaudii]
MAVAGLCLSAVFGVAHAAEPLKVVASFSILGDIVREVGGKDVSLATLVGPDGDAHEYEPTPGDAKKLSAAQVLFVNGLDFETWLPKLT